MMEMETDESYITIVRVKRHSGCFQRRPELAPSVWICRLRMLPAHTTRQSAGSDVSVVLGMTYWTCKVRRELTMVNWVI